MFNIYGKHCVNGERRYLLGTSSAALNPLVPKNNYGTHSDTALNLQGGFSSPLHSGIWCPFRTMVQYHSNAIPYKVSIIQGVTVRFSQLIYSSHLSHTFRTCSCNWQAVVCPQRIPLIRDGSKVLYAKGKVISFFTWIHSKWSTFSCVLFFIIFITVQYKAVLCIFCIICGTTFFQPFPSHTSSNPMNHLQQTSLASCGKARQCRRPLHTKLNE